MFLCIDKLLLLFFNWQKITIFFVADIFEMHDFFAQIHYYLIDNRQILLLLASDCQNKNFLHGWYFSKTWFLFINMLLFGQKSAKFMTDYWNMKFPHSWYILKCMTFMYKYFIILQNLHFFFFLLLKANFLNQTR